MFGEKVVKCICKHYQLGSADTVCSFLYLQTLSTQVSRHSLQFSVFANTINSGQPTQSAVFCICKHYQLRSADTVCSFLYLQTLSTQVSRHSLQFSVFANTINSGQPTQSAVFCICKHYQLRSADTVCSFLYLQTLSTQVSRHSLQFSVFANTINSGQPTQSAVFCICKHYQLRSADTVCSFLYLQTLSTQVSRHSLQFSVFANTINSGQQTQSAVFCICKHYQLRSADTVCSFLYLQTLSTQVSRHSLQFSVFANCL